MKFADYADALGVLKQGGVLTDREVEEMIKRAIGRAICGSCGGTRARLNGHDVTFDGEIRHNSGCPVPLLEAAERAEKGEPLG